ncbi:MAG: site-specific integrase [Methylobacter sp.]|nr:site-specific integrase [Methylobacter sp.]MDP2427485.1 site-specific integrase [Methylobacter sp.]MDP3055718.1 site-specific integrase [Methylobacter sp.]MDP3362880.1 site-specific integrase [Methylobacter sp.]MDZ4221237.1 site-specific integrase [Methylobacter sp.]
MSTIRKIQRQSGVVYKAIIKDRLGKAITSKTFTRKGDAVIWAKRIEADQEAIDALGSRGGKITFKELVDEYMRQWSGTDLNQHRRVSFWASELGHYQIKDIGGDLLRKKLTEFHHGGCIRGNGGKGKALVMTKTRQPATVNRHRTTLSGIFKYAVQQGYIVSNPVAKTACLRDAGKIVRYLNAGERSALLSACKQSEWAKLYLLVLMAMTTGMRKGELMRLRWSDIDFNIGLAFLETSKNGEPRVNPIPETTLTELKRLRELGRGLIFPSEKLPDQPMEFVKHWSKALEVSKVENFRFHDLRHDFCSQLAMHGASLNEIAELAGHKDLATTMRYTHLSTGHKKKLSDSIMQKVLNMSV